VELHGLSEILSSVSLEFLILLVISGVSVLVLPFDIPSQLTLQPAIPKGGKCMSRVLLGLNAVFTFLSATAVVLLVLPSATSQIPTFVDAIIAPIVTITNMKLHLVTEPKIACAETAPFVSLDNIK
jgi:hypothetical protein